MAMIGLRIMILLYRAGGEPGRGETPMRLLSRQPPDDFPSRRGCVVNTADYMGEIPRSHDRAANAASVESAHELFVILLRR